MIFWAYFEFKVVYAYRWHKYGVEKIIFKDNKVVLSKEISGRGITESYQLHEVNNWQLFENKDNNFIKSMATSYWNIKNYKLCFFQNKKLVPFAIDLDLKEAKNVLSTIMKYIK